MVLNRWILLQTKSRRVLIDNNSIVLGDCVQILSEFPDCHFDLFIADPPYKVVSGGGGNGKNSVRPRGVLKRHDGKLFNETLTDHSEWMESVYRVMKFNTHGYVFTNFMNLREMMNSVLNAGFEIHNLLVWVKNNNTPSQWYMKNCEYVLLVRKGKAKYINNIGSSKTAHNFNNIIGNRNHPTEKPIDLLEFYITNSSTENDLVLDPFSGSGNVGIACMNTGRRFILIEKDEKYYQVGINRIKSHDKH